MFLVLAMLVIFPTVCLLFESLLQVDSSIYFLYSSLAIFLNDLCHLYLFVFLMSEPVSLIELSKIVSLCTLVSKKTKNLVVFSHYMSIDLQIIYMYCRQSVSYNLVKLIFSFIVP